MLTVLNNFDRDFVLSILEQTPFGIFQLSITYLSLLFLFWNFISQIIRLFYVGYQLVSRFNENYPTLQ